jgi:hypothetical protein
VAGKVQFPANLRPLDDTSRGEIVGVLEQVVSTLSGIPPASAFWDSMQSSLLQIDVGGFHIVYRIEPDHRGIRIIELQQIPG